MVAPSRDRGQALPLVVLVLAFALTLGGVLAHVGGLIAAREQVGHAADGVALAGALGGEAAARAVAQANDVTLVSFRQDGDIVAVRVQGRGFTAGARAERVIELTADDLAG